MGRPAPYVLDSSVAVMTANRGVNGSSQKKAAPVPKIGSWTIGLINSSYKYLSAETFGFKVNANGKAMKKKQVWFLEPHGDEDSISLRCHMDRFLAVDQFGNVTCEKEERDDTCKFEISFCDDFSGRLALRSVSRGYFLGASADKLICSARSPGDGELWFVNMAVRPHLNLRSLGRKRFARLSEEKTEVQVEEIVPWGGDTLFSLEFQEEAHKYAVRSSNDRYLARDGRLLPEISPECLFACEYHGGYLALRDQAGLYLSPTGSRSVLKTRSSVVTKDQLFSLEDSPPQASFQAVTNHRFISVKQGVDVTANQEAIGDHETFQLEFDTSASKWSMRSTQDKYFTLQAGGGLQAGEPQPASAALFDLIWLEDGAVAFKAENGKYVGTKKSGHLFANVDTIEERSKYYFYLTNRPILVLRCQQGFVGCRGASDQRLECNLASYATIQVERASQGQVHFKGQNGKYWQVTEKGVLCDSQVPQSFFMELRGSNRMYIKTAGGQYVVEQKNGGLAVGGTDSEHATLWEC